jgi:hypothetical protein
MTAIDSIVHGFGKQYRIDFEWNITIYGKMTNLIRYSTYNAW